MFHPLFENTDRLYHKSFKKLPSFSQTLITSKKKKKEKKKTSRLRIKKKTRIPLLRYEWEDSKQALCRDGGTIVTHPQCDQQHQMKSLSLSLPVCILSFTPSLSLSFSLPNSLRTWKSFCWSFCISHVRYICIYVYMDAVCHQPVWHTGFD